MNPTLNSPKYADPKSLAFQMYKKQQDRKQRINPYVPQLEQRYFRRNEGSTDYATIPAVTLAGDFVIEYSVLVPDDGLFHQHITGVGTTINNEAANNIVVFANGALLATSSLTISRSGVNAVGVVRNGSVITFTINGVSENVPANTSQLSVSRLYDRTNIGSSSPLSGILANLKIYDNGTLVHYWKINSNANTEADLVSGAIMTFINGNASDWGLFDRQADGDWLGQELVVNGGFDSDSGWVKESEWSISDGSATMASTSSFNTIRQSVGFLPSLSYRVSLDVVAVTGTVKAMEIALAGTTNLPLFQFTANGNISKDVIIDSAGGRPSIGFARELVTSSCSIDNVSVKEVLKNA